MKIQKIMLVILVVVIMFLSVACDNGGGVQDRIKSDYNTAYQDSGLDTVFGKGANLTAGQITGKDYTEDTQCNILCD